MNANRRYVIIGRDEVESVDFTKVIQRSPKYLRYSNDGSKTFVKYNGDQPSFLSGRTEYTNSEMLAILKDKDGEWYSK